MQAVCALEILQDGPVDTGESTDQDRAACNAGASRSQRDIACASGVLGLHGTAAGIS